MINRETDVHTEKFSNPNDNAFSPILTRMRNYDFSGHKQRLEFSNSGQKYSPFVVKESPNLLNSNSSCKSKNFFNENSNQGQSYKIYSPSPNHIVRERLSDRFIPMNKGTNLLEKFELARRWSGKETITQGETDQDVNMECDDSVTNKTYSNLLENNFFNNDKEFFTKDISSKCNNSCINKDSSTPIKSKIFSFRTEQNKRKSHGLLNNNMPSINLLESFLSTETQNARKISNRPYKVIEAPGLLDDFYLNLVDWSSKNDLAVGQNNSVYLWCANKTQCVKLMSYSGDKYVSSVIWNPNGTEVAVGNSEGTVEIWDGKLFKNLFIFFFLINCLTKLLLILKIKIHLLIQY